MRNSQRKPARQIHIGLVYDLRSEYLSAGYSAKEVAEFDSEETIIEIETAIKSLGFNVTRVGNARALCGRLVAGERWDLVFNVAEGLRGRSREAQVPAILEVYEIPYTFSDPLTCAVTLDKAVAKKVVREAGLRTPDYRVVYHQRNIRDVHLKFPLFAKPIAEGTGKGITCRSLVNSPAELGVTCRSLLRSFMAPVLVEEFLPGREFTVGILGTGDKAYVLGTMEIEVLKKTGRTIYSMETKEKCETLVRYSPLRESGLRRRVEELALNCAVALECRDASRVDVRLDGMGRPSFMEVNPLPGLHPTHSDLPMIATQEGMSYQALIASIIRSSLCR